MKTKIAEELPYLPEGWAWGTLEECVDILDRQRIPINAKERKARIRGKPPSELYPYYGATGQVGWIDDFLFDEELVLLGEDGAPFLDAFEDKAYIIRGKSWVNNHAHVLRALKELMLNSFLCHYLNTFAYQDYVTGTTRFKLNQSRMRNIPVPIPPLSEQQRIVSKIEELFTKLDAGVKSLKNVKTQLQRYRQVVLKYAFEGKLTEEWRKTHKDQMELVQKFEEPTGEEQKKNEGGKPKESFLTDLSDLYELPTNWMWIRLGDITESMKNGIYKPKRFYRDDGIACLRMYNIKNGAIVWKDIKRMILTSEEAQAYELKIGDILVNRVNSRELVGKAAVIPEGLETCVYESKNIRLRLFVNFVDSKYVNFWFQVFRQKYFDRHAQQTVGMASINQEQLSSMPVPLSPLHEQCKIVEEIEHSFSIVNQIEKSVNHSTMQAEKLRQAVLKRAFRGKLVPQDPTDEPAEKLLERINERKKGNTEEKTRKGESDLKQVELMRYTK